MYVEPVHSLYQLFGGAMRLLEIVTMPFMWVIFTIFFALILIPSFILVLGFFGYCFITKKDPRDILDLALFL